MNSSKILDFKKIKEKITLSSIVSQYIKLKTKNTGEFIGLCPFHKERNPSFTVNDNKGLYYCFGCACYGDIISFIMKIEMLNHKEAANKIIDITGIQVEKIKLTNNTKKNELEKIHYMIFEETTKFYQKHLHYNNNEIINYLCNKRKIKIKTIISYRLGFSPYDQNKLFFYLKKKFTIKEIIATSIFGNNKSNFKDLMHGRIIFPIFDNKKRVIAFGGRIIKNNEKNKNKPKYINSYKNILFNKEKTLYGIHEIKKTYTTEIIIVEGYMDVLSLANIGFKNAVAPLGNNLKTSHIEYIWNFTKNITICMDSDNAGITAQKRIGLKIIKNITPEKAIYFIKLKENKDIDEAINKNNYNLNKIQQLMKTKISLADFLFNIEETSRKLTTPESIINFKNSLIDITNNIKNEDLKKEYKKYFLYLFYTKQYIKYNYNKNQQTKLLSLKNYSRDLMNKKNNHIIIYIILKFPQLLNNKKILNNFLNLKIEEKSILKEIKEHILLYIEKKSNEKEHKHYIQCIKNILKNSHNIAIKTNILTSKTINEAKRILIKAFYITKLLNLNSKIKSIQQILLNKPKNNLILQLFKLKSYELKYKNKFNII